VLADEANSNICTLDKINSNSQSDNILLGLTFSVAPIDFFRNFVSTVSVPPSYFSHLIPCSHHFPTSFVLLSSPLPGHSLLLSMHFFFPSSFGSFFPFLTFSVLTLCHLPLSAGDVSCSEYVEVNINARFTLEHIPVRHS